MTLCIAGECEHEGKPAIINCCDWRGVKGGWVSSDDVDKMREITEGSSVMLAGSLTAAEELFTMCRPSVERFLKYPPSSDADLHINELLNGLRTVTQERKRQIINEHVRLGWGISFQDFLEHGKRQLSDSIYGEVWASIRQLDLDAELIITTFASQSEPNDEAVIITVESSGHVSWESNYSTIGSGAPIAQAILCQSDYEDSMSLMDCLYRLYKAKRCAERNPAVGPETALEVLTQGKRYSVSSECQSLLWEEAEFPMDPALEFNPRFLERAGAE